MEARVNVVVNDLSVRGITQYPKAQVMCLYQLLLDLDIKAETIEAQLLQMPHLLCHSHKAWTNTCEVMVENGIPGLRILQSIALYPKFLKIKSSLLQDKLLLYRQMNVGKLNCLNLVIKYPVLLLGEPSHLKNRLDSLYALFPPASLKNLIQNNPNVLLDSWEDIMAKIMYIHEYRRWSLTPSPFVVTPSAASPSAREKQQAPNNCVLASSRLTPLAPSQEELQLPWLEGLSQAPRRRWMKKATHVSAVACTPPPCPPAGASPSTTLGP
ncbi:hypothetical protein E2C01_000241 [Portunus trituberculatus]|uniref:Uncharacterized protein n=1 Tax=Portunus trituberculatus TaxID=210409 RepID=A0A5B7CED9_PORTR|nr:hypothetical protein [Portunus trituberculatus]